MTQFFGKYFNDIHHHLNLVDFEVLEQAADLIAGVAAKKNKILIAGNGGSAAMASHVSVDFVKAARIRSVNFNEPDLITCFANDYGYPYWVSEALMAYSDPGDLVILISSSGQSENIINAALKAKEMGLGLVTFSGFSESNPLKKIGEINFWIGSNQYNYVEMVHHIWLLAIIDYLVSKENV